MERVAIAEGSAAPLSRRQAQAEPNPKPLLQRQLDFSHIVFQNCVKTPLIRAPGDLFERKADSPSYCFFEKVVRKRRASRAGFCGPKSGARDAAAQASANAAHLPSSYHAALAGSGSGFDFWSPGSRTNGIRLPSSVRGRSPQRWPCR